MNLAIPGFIFSFILALYVINRGFNLGLSLLGAAILTAIFAGLTPLSIIKSIIEGLLDYNTIQLMILVGFISGLGFIMKKTGALELMISSLNEIINSMRLLIVLIPVLIGTLNIPGGAILSAPMIEKGAKKVNLSPENTNAVNIFFRHIGFFIYPLYPSMILTGQLLEINIFEIIKFTFLVFLTGTITAFLFLTRGIIKKSDVNSQIENDDNKNHNNLYQSNVLGFLWGFLPVIIILVLALIFKIPFHLAVIIGTVAALFQNLNKNQKFFSAFVYRIQDFLFQGINYQLVLTIAGLMIFKYIIETAGIIEELTQILLQSGIHLLLMVTIMGLITGYVSGIHVAATGILAPLFLPLLPSNSIAVYGALLFTAINIGYIISPLHLCLILSNDYFDVNTPSLYKRLFPPLAAMLAVSILQVLIFA